ncbi:MAG TPA: DUF2785 domain-containing protein [Candidatus Acidoferrum sp.]|nr:DUF2785 domain-containing protein [Candidatus Acidoferrum sp.]
MDRAGARILLCVLFCLRMTGASAAAKGQGTSAEQSGHGREFWREIAKNHYAVPAGQEAFPLAKELSGYLGLPDPELRDDLAYSILAVWITRQKMLSTEELVTLLEEWQANLRAGIGETGTDSIFKRSFSALCLSALAERDLKEPFLGEALFRTLLNAALTYLGDERDLRGFDAKKGWIHTTAHTADLLAALAENKFFTKQDQERVLKAITQRLATANEVFSYGEQDRLANVAATIASRNDFDGGGWSSWVAQIDKEDRVAWNDSPPKMEALARFQNDSYFLSATAAQILLRSASGTSAEAQKSVLAVLRHR